MLIDRFKEEDERNILNLIANIGRENDVDCMRLTGFCKVTGKKPVYVFVAKGEVLVLLLDWRSDPELEVADEELYGEKTPIYVAQKSNRISPVWQLAQFTNQYRQAMEEAGIKLGNVWSVMVSNSRFFNYEQMMFLWETMHITVYHNLNSYTLPPVYHSCRYHRALALPQYKAFKKWCERRGELKHESLWTYDDFDIDDDEMDFGLNDDDEDVTDSKSDDDDLSEFLHHGEDFLLGSPKPPRPLSAEILQPLPSPRKELEQMVGCQHIKKQVDDLIALSRYNKRMHHYFPQWKQHQVSLHAIFFGRPGTGKTTVCKIYGGLLKEAGVLSKGHVVVCNRATFVGPSWGDEENAIRQAMEAAKGGVLMIDEAYLLNSTHPNDPGKLILPQFMDILANEQQRDIAIVLCGYKEPMQHLLDLNPGLASRFPNHFEFSDFSIDELMAITRRRLTEYGYHFTRAGLLKYRAVLSQAYDVRNPNNWGNARFVVNLLEHIYLVHAKRCMQSKSAHDIKSFFSITPADIQPIEVSKEKKRIGF
jgi:hypothetical protein